MIGAKEIIYEISGNAHLKCYRDLQLAVEIAHEHLPVLLSMKELTEIVSLKQSRRKSANAVSRALGRAIEDAWEYGDRYTLQNKYGFRSKPTPKELIFKLSHSIEEAVEYRMWKDPITGKYGVLAVIPDENYWMTVAPSLNDENQAAAIVHILNQNHTSLSCFRELAFTDRLTSLL